MYDLFASPKPGAAVPRKLAFYIAALQQLRRHEWLRLEKEVVREVAKLQEETPQEEKETPDPAYFP
jgi:hypothetical protein